MEVFGEKVLVGDIVQMPEGTLGNFTSEGTCDEQGLGTKHYY